jgi:cyanophycinase
MKSPTMPLLSLILGLIAIILTGCADFQKTTASTGSRGTLIAAGGSMHDENGEVHRHILQGSSRAIGIVTTASGDGAEALKTKRDGFAKWAPGREVLDIGLREDQPKMADDPSVVALIDRCDVLFFTGGDQKRIVEVFRPRTTDGEMFRRDSAAYKAVLRLLDRGGTVAGTSAGAAMMGDIMFHSGQIEPSVAFWSGRTSEQKQQIRQKFTSIGLFDVGETGVLKLGTGMGLVHNCIIDSHFAQRKRLGRLEIALDITGQAWGIGVNENRAIKIDRATGRVQTIGGTDEVATVVRRDPPASWKLSGLTQFTLGQAPVTNPGK